MAFRDPIDSKNKQTKVNDTVK